MKGCKPPPSRAWAEPSRAELSFLMAEQQHLWCHHRRRFHWLTPPNSSPALSLLSEVRDHTTCSLCLLLSLSLSCLAGGRAKSARAARDKRARRIGRRAASLASKREQISYLLFHFLPPNFAHCSLVLLAVSRGRTAAVQPRRRRRRRQ